MNKTLGLLLFVFSFALESGVSQNCEVFREEFNGNTTFTEVDQGFASTCAFATATLFDNNGSEHVMTVYAYNEGVLRKALTLPSKAYEIEVKWRFPANTQERLNACNLTRHDDTYGANCDVPKRLVAVNQVKKYEVSGITGAATQSFKIWHNGPINELVFAVGGNCAIAEYTTYIDQVVIRKASAKAAFDHVLIGDSLWLENLSIAFDATKVLWDFGDGSTSTELSPLHVFKDPGTYKVCLTVSNDCSQDSICKTVQITTGILTLIPGASRVYPNPATDRLRISELSVGTTWSIKDSHGRLLFSGTTDRPEHSDLDLSGLKSGKYFVELRNFGGTEVHSFIVYNQ